MAAGSQSHIVELSRRQREALQRWLETPNGSHVVSYRLAFDAVEDGGVLVRTGPYVHQSEINAIRMGMR